MAYIPAPGEKDLEKVVRSIRGAHERLTGLLIGDLADVNSTAPTDGQVLTWNDANSEWEPADASGSVTGPVSSTDNAVVRFDGVGGSTLQDSSFLVDDSGHVSSFGGNIKFPATQAASADANTLDDYEEGTWTPTFTFSTVGNFSPTYSVQVGNYLKVGRLVFIQCRIQFTTNAYTTASGTASIGGLPFTSASVSGGMGLATAGAVNITAEAGSYMLSFIIPANAVTIQFRWLKSAATHVVGTTTHFPASTSNILIDVGGCYLAAS